MTDHTSVSAQRGNVADLARRSAQRAVLEIAQATGGGIVTRPVFRDRPDLGMKITSAKPMLGMQIAAHLELAAKRLAAEYITHAREDGHTWHEIGVGLGLSSADESGTSAAEAAYEYAAGKPLLGRRSFSWVCPACNGAVTDRGPEAGHPADCEHGHHTNCPRLGAAVAKWHALWEGED